MEYTYRGMTVLSVQGLTKVFPAKRSLWGTIKQESCTAVSNVSFTVNQGETVGLLGPNGSGKTTIIHMLLSTLTPTAGTISYFDQDFKKYRSSLLQQVGFASTYVKMPPRLSVYTNLDIYGRLYGLSRTQRAATIEHYLKFFGIWQVKDREVGVLSAGQATRVMLAKAFLADPKIVLLDEPTASLDPDVAYEIRQFILRQQELGVSFLITSHNMVEVTQLCDRVLFLKNGCIVADNTPEYLAQSIARARIQLNMSEDIERTVMYAKDLGFSYTVLPTGIEIEVDESRIAEFLMVLARMGIHYSHIAIHKPTLEDYFVHVIKSEVRNGILPGMGSNAQAPASHNT